MLKELAFNFLFSLAMANSPKDFQEKCVHIHEGVEGFVEILNSNHKFIYLFVCVSDTLFIHTYIIFVLMKFNFSANLAFPIHGQKSGKMILA